jgi:hypothetical protein
MFVSVKRIATAYACLSLCAPLVFADTVVLKNGQTIEGNIVPLTNGDGVIQIESHSGIIYDIAKDRIDRVEFSGNDLPTTADETVPRISDLQRKDSQQFRPRMNTNEIFAGIVTLAVTGTIYFYNFRDDYTESVYGSDTGRRNNVTEPGAIIMSAWIGSVVGLIVRSLAYDGDLASSTTKNTPHRAFSLHPRLIGKTVLLTVNVAL